MYTSVVLLTSALAGGESSASHPASFTLGDRAPVTHCIGGCIGPTIGLDVERRKIFPLLGLELQPLGRPASSQSLYRLRYPGSLVKAI
jgi:hypothetical protein